MATNAVATGSNSAEVEAHGVAPVHRHVVEALERAAERRLEAAVDLDGVHVRAVPGQARRERAHSRADLERHVVGPQLGQPLDHAEQVVVHEEVLAEARVGPEAELGQPRERDLARGVHGKAKTRAALASTCAASSGTATPRMAATAPSVSST